MPSLHHKCVLFITYNPDNIWKKSLFVRAVFTLGSVYTIHT